MKKKHNFKPILITLMLLAVVYSIYLIYNICLYKSIENVIRYIIITILVITDFIIIFFGIRKMRDINKKVIVYTIFTSIYIIAIIFSSITLNSIYSSISNITKEETIYKTFLIAKSDSKIDDISEITDLRIGILNDKTSIEGYIVSHNIINKYNLNTNNIIVDYNTYPEMLNDLNKGTINLMFVPSNYKTIFNSVDEYKNIIKETKEIFNMTESIDKNETFVDMTKKAKASINEPFTILLMGVDSEVDGLDKNMASNGDSLVLITFNPKTLNITMLSLPRDSYVPIVCWYNQIENKLTHAAWNGEGCMINTIENFLGITIDYYVKINFKGVVNLVDALGGIDVNVPQRLCTDNSSRQDTVCIEQGEQHLNGEEALVLTRNRYDLENGDFGRQENQQIVLKAMLDAVKKNITSVSKILNILEEASRNMDTNFTTEQILSFYNLLKDIMLKKVSNDNPFNIQQLVFSGTGQMIYDEGMGMVLWNYILNNDSVNAVGKAMRVNLGLEEEEIIKNFSFSLKQNYVKSKIGDGYYYNPGYDIMLDFTNDTRDTVTSWANQYNMNVEFETIKVTGEQYTNGLVFEQSYPAYKRLDKIGKNVIVFKIADKDETINEIIDCSLEKNINECVAPNFSKMTKEEAINFINNFKDIEIVFNDIVLVEVENGTITSQDVNYGDTLQNGMVINLTIVNNSQ